MKNLLVLVITLALAISVTSCKKDVSVDPENATDNSKKAEEYIASQKEKKEENSEKDAKDSGNKKAEEKPEVPTEKPLPSANMPEVETTDDWKEFLAEYDAWVDEYIVVFNKYKNNRQDKDILLEYAKMQQQLAEWNEKTEEYVIKLEITPEVLEEYTNAIAKIAVKFTEGTMQ